MPKDVYLQPNAPDPVLSEDVVLSLIRKHVESVKAVTYVDESGGEARTYAIDDEMICKIQRPHRLRPRTSLEKEVFFLNFLKSDARISAPQVLDYGMENSIEYTIMTRMPGVAVATTTVEGGARKNMLYNLGQM